MNRFESFLVGLASGVAILYVVMHFTVVRASDGFHWVPKLNAKIDLPYEDVRDFQAEHWQRRPALTMSILRARKGYLVDDRTKMQVQQTTQKVVSQTRLQSASNSLYARSASSNR